MSQVHVIPAELYLISQGVTMLRFLLCSLWGGSHHCWGSDSPIRILQAICDFGFFESGDRGQLIYAIIYISLAFLIFLWHIYVFANFIISHTFITWHIVVTRFLHQCLIPILLPAYATCAGFYLNAVFTRGLSADPMDSLDSTLFSLALISTVGLTALFRYAYGFACFSPVLLYQSPFAAWDPKLGSFLVLLTVITSFLAPALDIFLSWVVIIAILVLIAVTVFFALGVWYFPFQKFLMNAVFCGLAAGASLAHVFAAAASLGAVATLPVVLPLLLLATASGTAGAFALLTRKRRALAARLSYSAVTPNSDRPSDSEKRDYFEGLPKLTERETLASLRVGVSEGCELFVDVSYTRFLLERRPSAVLLFAIAEMLSFLPAELQFFGNSLAQLGKLKSLSLYAQFQLFQFRKIFVTRQSSVSKDATSMIRKLRHQASDARAAIRAAWVDIMKNPADLDFNLLAVIHDLSHKLRCEFRDLTERYANNQELCNEFALFLIEATGEFREAYRWRARAQLIEQGAYFVRDFTFRSFANCFPHLLLRRVFSDTGACLLTRAAATKLESQGSFESHNSSSEPALDEIGPATIHDAVLRDAVENALSAMTLPAFANLRTVLTVVHALCFLVGVVLLAVVPPIRASTTLFGSHLTALDRLYEHFSQAVLAGGIQFGSDKWYNAYGGLAQLREQTGVRAFDMFLVSQDTAMAAWRGSRLARAAFSDLVSQIVTQRGARPLAAAVLTDEMTTLSQVSTLNESVTSGRGVIIYALDRIAVGAAYAGTEKYALDDWDTHYLGWMRLFEGMIDLAKNLPFMQHFREALLDDGRNTFRSYQSTFEVLQYVVPVAAGAVFLYVVASALYAFFRAFQDALDLLRAVQPDAVERSVLPIAKGVKRDRMDQGSTQLARGGAFPMRALPLFAIGSVVLNAVAFAGAFALSIGKLDEVNRLLLWYKFAEDRALCVTQLVGLMGLLSSCPHGPDFSPIHLLIYDAILLNVAEYDAARLVLLVGEDDMPSMLGFSADLDRAELIDECDTSSATIHDFVRCVSVNRLCGEASVLIRKILQEAKPWVTCDPGESHCGRLPTEQFDFSMLVVLVDGALSRRLADFGKLLLAYAGERFNTVTDMMTIVAVVILVVNVAFLVLLCVLLVRIAHAMSAFKGLLRVLPPRDLLADSRLVEFVAGIDRSNERIATPAEVVVDAASEAICSISLDYAIDGVNCAFRQFSGLSPDEVLGQQLLLVFPDGECPLLYERLERMRAGEPRGPPIALVATIAAGTVPVDVLPIAHIDANGRPVSFSLLIHDLSSHARGVEARMGLKERCDRILQAFLPMEVYAGMHCATGTVFSSPKVTILAIGIGGFLDNIASYSPSQMMETISAIHDLFDEVMSLYPSVRKIRSGAGDIICCCGLFDYMDQHADQAEHAVLAGLEFTCRREEVCEKLAIEMNIRCGIAFGGPIVGDLLSVQTPRFDLLGDVVTEAVALRADAASGEVFITKGVKELLNDARYECVKVKASLQNVWQVKIRGGTGGAVVVVAAGGA